MAERAVAAGFPGAVETGYWKMSSLPANDVIEQLVRQEDDFWTQFFPSWTTEMVNEYCRFAKMRRTL
jgi:hypothetical protein